MSKYHILFHRYSPAPLWILQALMLLSDIYFHFAFFFSLSPAFYCSHSTTCRVTHTHHPYRHLVTNGFVCLLWVEESSDNSGCKVISELFTLTSWAYLLHYLHLGLPKCTCVYEGENGRNQVFERLLWCLSCFVFSNMQNVLVFYIRYIHIHMVAIFP